MIRTAVAVGIVVVVLPLLAWMYLREPATSGQPVRAAGNEVVVKKAGDGSGGNNRQDSRPKKCPDRVEFFVNGELQGTATGKEILSDGRVIRIKERDALPLAELLDAHPEAESVAVYSCWPREREVFGREKFRSNQPVLALVPNRKGAIKLERIRGEASATVFRGIRRVDVTDATPEQVIDAWRNEWATSVPGDRGAGS